MKMAPDLYLAVRQREGRIYLDGVVERLPDVGLDHPHRNEWLARRASARRLLAYVRRRPKPLRVLDLGCGNGWLSASLSGLPQTYVMGLDTNLTELAQAARVFHAADRAGFLAGDVLRPPWPEGSFDVAVIASSIQYFDDLGGLLRAVGSLLRPGGEAHILDSPIYEDPDVDAARHRSEAYYAQLGFPEMAVRYHHHTWAALDGFDVACLYDPGTLSARLQRRLGHVDSPFPWLRVRFPA
jgi:SAM-dependent methyltransferase